MKRFFRNQYAVFHQLELTKVPMRYLCWFISLVLSLYVLIILSIPLYETSGHRGEVFAIDNDGGRAIEISMATRWYNSNHFAPYGNLYYRLSQTLADLIPLPQTEELSPQENREKSHNFALKLISLVSVFSLGLFVGWIFWGGTFVLPLFASAFTLLATDIELWSVWIFRPHPDHLLMLMSAIATFFFAKLLAAPEDRKTFIVSAVMWGLAMAVKRSTATFIPAILLIMLFPINKDSIQKTLSYIGYMLGAYLIIGFPQNFGFYKHIKFLLFESGLHSRGDWISIRDNLRHIFEQLLILLPIIVLPSFFSSRLEKLFSRKLLLFLVLSFIPVLSRKMSFPGEQHTMPLAIATFVVLVLFMLHFNRFRYTRNSLGIVAVASILFLKFHGISPVYSENKLSQLTCRPEIHEMTQLLKNELSSGKRLLKEPYFPYRSTMEPFIEAHWGLEWEKVNQTVKYLGLNRKSFNTYATNHQENLYGKELEGLTGKKAFYQSLRDVNEVVSPQGIRFKKIISTACGFELWKKI